MHFPDVWKGKKGPFWHSTRLSTSALQYIIYMAGIGALLTPFGHRLFTWLQCNSSVWPWLAGLKLPPSSIHPLLRGLIAYISIGVQCRSHACTQHVHRSPRPVILRLSVEYLNFLSTPNSLMSSNHSPHGLPLLHSPSFHDLLYTMFFLHRTLQQVQRMHFFTSIAVIYNLLTAIYERNLCMQSDLCLFILALLYPIHRKDKHDCILGMAVCIPLSACNALHIEEIIVQ